MRISPFQQLITGMAVSFVGSLPLGYLNVIAVQLFLTQSWYGLLFFLLGVIVVELVVIQITLVGARRLLDNTRLLFWIDIFTVCFLTLLAFSFLYGGKEDDTKIALPAYLVSIHPLVVGLALNGLNFIQLPFWAGWNIFLIKSQKINPRQSVYYLAGAGIGTFVGMLLFVLLVHAFAHMPFVGRNMAYLLFIIFIALAMMPLWKVIKSFTSSST